MTTNKKNATKQKATKREPVKANTINTKVFERALKYIQRTGLPQELDELLRPEGSGGRPRALRIDVLLAAMLLTYLSEKCLFLNVVHEVLTVGLARPTQATYGIRAFGQEPITVRQVRYTWNAIADKLDHTHTRAPDLDDTDRELRKEAFQAVLDALTGAASTHFPTAPAYAADLTAIDSAARSRHYREYNPDDHDPEPDYSADPDARKGYRTRTYDNRSTSLFGYQALALVRAAALDGPPEPLLIDRIALVPANEKGMPETLAALDSLTDTGGRPDEIIADRGFSYTAVDQWAGPLRDRGIRQVLDLHEIDRGARAHPTDGYVMVDGWPHCPSIPDHLVGITRPPRLAVGAKPTRKKKAPTAYRDELRTWKQDRDALARARELMAERAQYRFEPVGVTSAGNTRFACPARTGKIVCRGCPLYDRGVPEGTGLPEVTAPDPLPRACQQRTITIAGDVDLKRRQEHYWLSDEWIRSYSRRPRVEGAFGILKGTTTGGIRRGWMKQFGLIRTGLLLAVAVAATNLHSLLRWSDQTGDTRDELTTYDVTDYGFAEYDENGNLPEPGAPPGG